jgi:hypothetical protein
LIKVGNYYVGDHTNYYKKNHILFDLVFRNEDNKYGIWLDKSKNNDDCDIIHKLLVNEFSKLDKENNYSIYNNIPYVDTGLDTKKLKIKSNELNYDLEKLHNISNKIFPYYYKRLLRLNRSAIHPELKFISFIHFDNNGLPTGRPYSYFCSTLNPKKQHKDNSGELRPDFLNRIGIPDYYEVYDIKSQVPRVNYLFHTGIWKDDDYDFYSEIIKDTEMMEYLEYEIPRGKTEYTEYNDSMKQLFMKIYFGKGSDEQSYMGYYNEKLSRKSELKDNYYIFKSIQNDYIENLDIWEIICNSTKKIVGSSIGNLIFWFLFFIETEVKIELLRRGKKVYNVYDGFYYNKDISNEIKDILKIKAKYVYNKYMKLIKI